MKKTIKQLSIILALLNLSDVYACNISLQQNIMTIIVEKGQEKICLKSEESKIFFRSAIVSTTQVSNRNTNSSSSRSVSARKLYNFSDLQRQSEFLNTKPHGPTYYGQK